MANQRSSAGTRRHQALGAALRLATVAALTCGWLLSAAPAGAQDANVLDGDTYTSEQYGWSVQFDEDVWTAEQVDERNSQGVALSGETGEIFVNLVVYDDGIADGQDCLDDLIDAFESSSDWEDVAVARGLDEPETGDDALAALYTGTLVLDDGSLDVVLYLECREVVDATLTIAMTALADAYEDAVPDLSTLLTAVDTGGGGGSGDPDPNGPVDRNGGEDPTPEEGDPTEETEDPTPDAEETPDDPVAADHEPEDQLGARDEGTLDDGSYVAELGYALTWDAEVYEGETADDEGIGVLLENGESGATFEVAAFEDPAIEECIDAEVNRFLESEDYVSAAVSNGVRPPTSSEDAVGRMLRATEDTTKQQRKIIYVECRPLLDEGDDGDPVFLVVRAISDDEDFRASRTEFETILAAITIGDEPAPTPTEEAEEEDPTPRPTREATEEPEEEPTPRPRRTPTPEAADLGETDLAGGVFVSQAFGVSIEWDPAVYTTEAIDDQGLEGFSFSAELGSFGRVLTANTGTEITEANCISSLVSGWTETTPDLADYVPPAGQEIAFPEDTGSIYGIGTLTLEDGRQVSLISAGGCLELAGGQGFLIMVMQTFDGLYPDNAAAFNAMLETVEIAPGGGQVGLVSAPARASAAGTSPAPRAVLRDRSRSPLLD